MKEQKGYTITDQYDMYFITCTMNIEVPERIPIVRGAIVSEPCLTNRQLQTAVAAKSLQLRAVIKFCLSAAGVLFKSLWLCLITYK